MLLNLKKIIFTCVLLICSVFGANTLASDNVLQAIQINGINDSYNIILKSDDIAEVKKTIQAPNKMMLVLNGIRASKTINTIYSNTSTVDSVVVEPVNNNTVKILIQAANVSNAQVHFDSLKTPLGVLNNENNVQEQENKPKSEILLSAPVNSFRPVFEREEDDIDDELFSTGTDSLLVMAKKVLKSEKLSWITTFGLFTILVLSGIGSLRRKENEIKIGLSSHQNMQQREIDLYRNMNLDMQNTMSQVGLGQIQPQTSPQSMNYGLKAYQNNTRNPYTTPEIQRPRVMSQMNTSQIQQTSAGTTINQGPNALQKAAQDIIKRNAAAAGKAPVSAQKSMTKPSAMTAQKPKTANIDSMKFLESMTKIYEKNGRSDLAQGLKNNMQKAKANIA